MSLPLEAPLQPVVPGPYLGRQHTYFVRHRRARRYILRVEPDGRLRVTIPRGGSQRAAEEFAGRHDAWVERQRARLVGAAPLAAGVADARVRAGEELPRLLYEWAARLGLTVSAVSVRNQRTRWGSCGRNGRICLNWRLLLMPEWVRDYVLVHELMHLKRLDHSRRFWALVAEAYPAYREARTWLREHGSRLR
jgi:predicted metal-dependent hydrolase